MIKGITASGKYILVTGNASSTYVSNYSGAQGVGNVRFNTTNQNLEVYDGNNWTTMNMAYPNIGLSGEAESLLDWARQKRNEEWELERLAASNPTIKDLTDKVKLYQDQIKMVQTLIKKDREWAEMEAEQTQSSP